jgi:hypothetical protein
MTKTAILDELPRLTVEERQEIRLKLAELDHDDWLDDGELTDEEKRLIERRVREMEQTPEASIPWKVAETRLHSRYGK